MWSVERNILLSLKCPLMKMYKQKIKVNAVCFRVMNTFMATCELLYGGLILLKRIIISLADVNVFLKKGDAPCLVKGYHFTACSFKIAFHNTDLCSCC